MDDNEIDVLAEAGIKVAHNPESNMKLAAGVAPVPKMLRRRIGRTIAERRRETCHRPSPLLRFHAGAEALLFPFVPCIMAFKCPKTPFARGGPSHRSDHVLNSGEGSP
jgi:hypothetical protein